MKWLLALLLCVNVFAADPRIKIAVIDTGMPTGFDLLPYLCADGHVDYTGEGVEDAHGHATNVTWLITRDLDPKKFCIVSLKYFSNKGAGIFNLTNELKAIKKAIELKVKYINLSGGGDDPSKEEYELFAKALTDGIHITVAAGNEGRNLDTCEIKYYPACYYPRFLPLIRDNFWVVANGKGTRTYPSSNYGGPVRAIRDGQQVGPEGKKMSGTSQATAVFLNELIKRENP